MSIGNIRKKITKEIKLCLKDTSEIYGAYGFGSFFRSRTFNDVDILIVIYDEFASSLELFYDIKSKLEKVGFSYSLVIDITYLSHTEHSRKPLRESGSLTKIFSR